MDVRRALAPSDELGESPLWPAAALVAAAGLYADLPSRFIVSSGGGAFGVVRWVVPALTVLVLVALGIIRPSGPFARALERRPEVLRVTRRRLVLLAPPDPDGPARTIEAGIAAVAGLR